MDVTSSSGPEIQSTSNAHSTARPQSPQPGAVAAAPPARGTTQQHRDGSFGSGASGRSGTGSHGSGQVGSSPNYSASTCSYGRQRRYRLEIVSLPAYCATSGAGLCSPTLVVRLHVEPTSPRAAGEGSASDSDSRHVSAGSMAQEDVPYLISNVSVWSADGSLQLMPAPASGAADGTAVSHTSGPPLMRGRLVVHGQLLKDTQGHENVYFIFPSLQLTRPGQWRLGVSLFGLWPGGSAIQDRRRSSQSSNADASTGSLLATVVASLPTTAYDEDDVAGLEEAALAIRQSPGHHETEDLLAEFRQQGADLSASELSSEGSEEGH
ncbi:hypothetical protein BCR37DRAFT_393412 [Protomyces lactucae-debilis]|uniref:Velvet domain-containing protein n=1 Tax=Protomyces lactucae-debilis TaxID=2754530 RepID=A0A1Y2FCA7_PROLT|nr:uncharacterized protein BCR37DRAFT_393412 [Protomyces lactucae-debilis]ORY81559.1 hypothetical protein BCR37DRAFT_393412 [Protomyces lactucae-debilis]